MQDNSFNIMDISAIFETIIAMYYWLHPIIFIVISLTAKKKPVKITALFLNIGYGVFWIITAGNYAGGGGFGDLFSVLIGIAILFASLIQGIIIYFQIKRATQKQAEKSDL